MLMQFKQFSGSLWVFLFFIKAEKMYLNKEICLIPSCFLESPYYLCQLIPQNDGYQN